MSLKVTIPDTFSGPLDLLLHLIRRDEMDIYDIPIAQLTNAYLEELQKLEIIDVDEGAEFLDLASRLLEIKSRLLLPPDELEETEEEEEDDFDPRTGLVEALLEYRRFKDAAKTLGDMAEEQARRYPRISPKMEFSQLQAESAISSSNDLMRAFQNMLDRMLTDFSDAPDVINYTEVSIATRIQQIEENLLAVEKNRFSRLLSDAPTRGEMVGLFVAILELVRQGRIIARQTDNFSDIVLERRERPAVPASVVTIGRRLSARSGFPGAPRPVAKASVLPPKRQRPFPAPPTRTKCGKTPPKRKKTLAIFPAPARAACHKAPGPRSRRKTR